MPTIRDRPPGWVPGPAVDGIIHEDPLSESDEDKEEEDSASHWWHNFGEEAGDKFDDNEEDEPLARRNKRWCSHIDGEGVDQMKRGHLTKHNNQPYTIAITIILKLTLILTVV